MFFKMSKKKLKCLKTNKKSQTMEAFGAASIVVVMFVVFVLYLVFIPPAKRIELLFGEDGSSGDNDDTNGNSKVEKVIFQKNIGRVSPDLKGEFVYPLSSFSVYRVQNSEVIVSENDFSVYNNWFSKQNKDIVFSGENVAGDLVVSFLSESKTGSLVVFLNGKKIYEDDGKSTITIDNSLLEDKNILLFEVSDVGMAFWKNNNFNIKNFEILGKVSKDSTSDFETKFFLSGLELENIKEAKYVATFDCQKSPDNFVRVFLNGRSLFSGNPACNIPNIFDFEIDYLKEGENVLYFSSEKGNYFVYGQEVKLKTKTLNPVPFYFDIDDDYFNDDYSYNFTIDFVTSGRKDFYVSINGYEKNIISNDNSFWFMIDHYVKEKNNYFLFNSSSVLDIAEVKIIAQKN